MEGKDRPVVYLVITLGVVFVIAIGLTLVVLNLRKNTPAPTPEAQSSNPPALSEQEWLVSSSQVPGYSLRVTNPQFFEPIGEQLARISRFSRFEVTLVDAPFDNNQLLGSDGKLVGSFEPKLVSDTQSEITVYLSQESLANPQKASRVITFFVLRYLYAQVYSQSPEKIDRETYSTLDQLSDSGAGYPLEVIRTN